MREQTYTTDEISFHGKVTPIYKYPDRYRIEVKRTEHGWFQRHIWIWDTGEVRTEKWIKSFDHDKPGQLDNFRPVTGQAA